MRPAPRAIGAWLVIVGLAGSVLGVLEGLGHVWQDPPLSLAEAVLVLAWGSLAYTVPSLLLAVVWMGFAKARNRRIEQVIGIPGALLALGVWVAILVNNKLWADGVLKILVELPASTALAVGLCLLVRHRWPVRLNSVHVWILLQGLTLAAVGYWLAVRYTTGGQMLAIVSMATVVGACCVWGLARPSRQRQALVGASGFGVTALILLALWPKAYAMATARTAEQPNVLLITVDTLRADHLGAYGYTKGQTPAMDRMAAEGVVFEEALASAPFTCPSHTSILTGLDPMQHGNVENTKHLNAGVVVLSEMLSSHGYETAAFISGWTLKHRACGLGSAFGTYFEDFSPWGWLPQSATKVRAIRLLIPIARRFGFDLQRVERPAAETTDAVLHWLERTHNRPFFLWVHYFDPHLPYAPPPPYDRLFDPDYAGFVDGRWFRLSDQTKTRIIRTPADVHHMIARYDGEVAYADDQIGHLQEALRRLNLDRNTLVILTADHGESHGEHHVYFDRDLHRSSLRVPLILKFPERAEQPRHVSDRVRLIDITPTVLDYLQIRADVSFAGKSLLPLVRGDVGREARPLFALFPRDEFPGSDKGMLALQDRGYKLIWISDRWYAGLRVPSREELYNVRTDPEENSNIVKGEPAALSGLRDRLTQWREQGIPDHPEPTGEMRTILKSLGYVK